MISDIHISHSICVGAANLWIPLTPWNPAWKMKELWWDSYLCGWYHMNISWNIMLHRDVLYITWIIIRICITIITLPKMQGIFFVHPFLQNQKWPKWHSLIIHGQPHRVKKPISFWQLCAAERSPSNRNSFWQGNSKCATVSCASVSTCLSWTFLTRLRRQQRTVPASGSFHPRSPSNNKSPQSNQHKHKNSGQSSGLWLWIQLDEGQFAPQLFHLQEIPSLFS